MPTAQTYGPDYRFYAAHNVEGVFTELEFEILADMRDLKVWLMMKQLEDPFADYGRLLRIFTDGFYGPAGPIQWNAGLEMGPRQARARSAATARFSDPAERPLAGCTALTPFRPGLAARSLQDRSQVLASLLTVDGIGASGAEIRRDRVLGRGMPRAQDAHAAVQGAPPQVQRAVDQQLGVGARYQYRR